MKKKNILALFKRYSSLVAISAPLLLTACGDDNDTKYDDEISDLQSQINQLNQTIADLTSSSNEEIAAIQAQLDALSEQIASLGELTAEQITDLQAQLAELTTQLETEITQIRNDLEEQIADLEEQIADLKEQVDALDALVDTDQIAALQTQIAALESQAAALGARVLTLNAQIASLNAQIAVLDVAIVNAVPTYAENLSLNEVAMVYSHNSYDSREDRWPNTTLTAQLDAGVRVLELDLYGTDGLIAHDDATVNQHCASIDDCLDVVIEWSEANDGHYPLLLQFEMTDNGTNLTDDEPADAQMADRTERVRAKMDLLAEKLAPLAEAGKLISYEESLSEMRYLRGKFLISVYRKYNTPFYQRRADGFSSRQTLPITTALELSQDTAMGENYRRLLVNNNIFLTSRYIGDESPDGWEFIDPDYIGMERLEVEAGLSGNMLRLLKQDNAAYSAEGFTENTLMISNTDSSDPNKGLNSLANAIGTHGLDTIRNDVVAKAVLDNNGLLPHCSRSGRDREKLSYCSRTEMANQFNTATTIRFAVIPDSQGRDDDWGKNKVTLPDGSRTHSGRDLNGDNIFDGNGIAIDVSDPWNPVAILDDETGEPVEVAFDDRQDEPYDYKIFPSELTGPMVQKIIEENATMAISIGDMTDYRSEVEYVKWMDRVVTPLAESDIKVYPIRGNHEIVDGRDWERWFTQDVEPREKKSVNNVDNGIDPYEGHDPLAYDQGYKLYSAYPGSLIQDEINAGNVTGYPGIEDLVYYFVKDNTLFVAVDVYASELVSTCYECTWLTFFPWVKDVITSHREAVDHVIVYAHEAFTTKKRPTLFDEAEYNNYLASTEPDADDAEPLPGIMGIDVGQLGQLELQDESSPGLSEEVLGFFAENDVIYIAGHDHQYSHSVIHSVKGDKTSNYFNHFVSGNVSWKSYNNRYGENPHYETLISQDNHSNSDEKNTKVSFMMVEIAGRQVTTTHWYARHSLSEDDVTHGAYWDAESNTWFKPQSFDAESGEVVFEEIPVVWEKGEVFTHTAGAAKRLVSPLENYWATTSTPENQGYIGTEASILDGYNLTYNSVEVFRSGETEVSIDMFARDDNGNVIMETYSYADPDSGEPVCVRQIPRVIEVDYILDENNDGTGEFLQNIGYTSENVVVDNKTCTYEEVVTTVYPNESTARRVDNLSELVSLSWMVDEDVTTVSDILLISNTRAQDGTYDNNYGYAQPASTSQNYFNKDGEERTNPTQVVRDGEITDEDNADAFAIAITAPEGVELNTLTIAKYVDGVWVDVMSPVCLTSTGYSDDFSVMYSGQGPEGNEPDGCNYQYWGYNFNNNSVWGFIHTDGHYALIPRN